MKAQKFSQPQESKVMEEQQGIQVVLKNDRSATVTRQGDVYLLETENATRRYSFQVLVNLSRCGEQPEWCAQVPDLSERIERVFQSERDAGIDPFTRVASERGRISVTDLRSGSAWGASISDLKRQLAQTGRLPRAFSSSQARQLIDSAA